MSIKSPRTRKIYLLTWAGTFLALMLYARIANIGTGQYLILGALAIIFLGLVGIVFALHEEMGRAGKDPWPINQLVERKSFSLDWIPVEFVRTGAQNSS